MDESKEPPQYLNGGGSPRTQLPQVAYMNQQSPYMGEQPLTGQPFMMPMNTNTVVTQQPVQLQTATVLTPGTMLVPQRNIYYSFLSEEC
jgi:hypothetical protein